jgi:Dyp-type peroxidase family
VRRVHREKGRIWRQGLGPAREPFGFADGISVQRFFSGRPPLDTALDQVFCQDELHGGTFLVLRKLEQNVRLFRECQAELERTRGAEEARRLVEGLVGRSKNGRPLTQHRGPNGFDFADDPAGRRCPFHAHIRRSNPRAVRNDAPDPENLRLVRRGVVYGSDGDLEDAAGATGGVGLLFLAYMHSLDTFRTMQGNWLAYAHFPIRERTTPPDGIIHGPPEDWRPYDPAQRFVTPRGGAYFFVPGLRWLRALAAPGNAV